jgi:aminopeptidase N
MSEPKRVYRSDYRPPSWWIDRVDLDFALDASRTRVRARLELRRNPDAADDAPLALDGEELELLRVAVDGRVLAPGEVQLGPETLTLSRLPARCVVETEVAIRPELNTRLSGLYASSSMLCTQCEAHGFRRITYFLDRPDVMARFSARLEGDRERFPVLLSNGNRVEAGELPGGRHFVRWEDPHRKPCYLFALVAGDLRCHAGAFRTRSGRDVRLEIWVEEPNLPKCEHALRSLEKAMAWDERAFGREYDLDVYMIVAVDHFNMGAMENKGLNLFNSKFVLALPETATDDDYEAIEGVIAHEYFHNWTGNRVTCRDWFQLTLKEGLTVYRDQEFSADMASRAVKRIDDVRQLRLAQFPEDAGPMAHPIRPESYLSMDNFYTPTVYEKGAEVVRLYETLLGRDGFRRGMDLYFERHDGQAVTCDDFRAAMADANGADLAQFERWYSTPGTPIVEASGTYRAEDASYELVLRQKAPETRAGHAYQPLHIPIRMGLLGSDGRDLPLRLAGEGASAAAPTMRVLELRAEEQRFRFTGIASAPVASLLRGFSAPVALRAQCAAGELAFRMAHDSDAFNRWEAGQSLAQDSILGMARAYAEGRPVELARSFVDAFGALLRDASLDPSLKALAMALPAERVLAQAMSVIDVDALHAARETAIRALARALRSEFEALYRENLDRGAYQISPEAIARRRLKNAALRYLTCEGQPAELERLHEQFETANNMTDAQAALVLLADHPGAARDRALAGFYERWRGDPLVLDKWFSVQALAQAPDALVRVQALAAHVDFTLRNPNRVRALVTTFATGNPWHFHARSGAGYAFAADHVMALDALNPQLAARLVGCFNPWRRYDAARQAQMKAQLERIAGREGLSKDVFEIVERALQG